MLIITAAVLVLIVCGIQGAPAPHTCDFHGKTFTVDESFEDPLSCNTCYCGTSGVACTKVYCPKDPVGREVINPHPGFCEYGGEMHKVGEGFKSTDGCNSCGCSENGMVMCTLMACLHLENRPDREVINPHPGFCDYGGQTYKAGEGFKSTDGCNHCGCSENGLVMCTLMACVDIHSLSVLENRPDREVINPHPGFCDYGGQTYKAGEGFKSTDGCNHCGCSENGLIMCTLMACVDIHSLPVLENRPDREVINPHPGFCDYGGQTYKAGEGFKSTDGCNHCGCSENGLIMCTLMACVDIHSLPVLENRPDREVINPHPGFCDYGGQTYKAGEGFKSTDGCNHCGCSENGLIMCTLMACVDIHSLPVLEKPSVAREVINPMSCQYGGQTYHTGEMFKSTDGCNSCGCSPEGFVICTQRGCLHVPSHERRFIPRRCFYNGEWFSDGDVTASTDGCNTCTCMIEDRGLHPAVMACTEMACMPRSISK